VKKGPDSLVTEAMIEEVHLLIGEKDGMIFELFSEAEGDFGAVVSSTVIPGQPTQRCSILLSAEIYRGQDRR